MFAYQDEKKQDRQTRHTQHRKAVLGKGLHSVLLRYDPLTGKAFSQEKRFQTNYLVKRSVLFPELRHEDFYWPVIWHERGFVEYSDDVFEYHSTVLVFKGLKRLTKGIGLGFGLLLVLLGAFIWRLASDERARRLAMKADAVTKRM
jgi:hypothetical protein